MIQGVDLHQKGIVCMKKVRKQLEIDKAEGERGEQGSGQGKRGGLIGELQQTGDHDGR